MNSKALVLAAATTGVAVVTMVSLNLVAPISHAAEAHGNATGVTADQVFAASISEPGASSPEARPMEVAALTDAATPAAETAPEPAVTETPAPASSPAPSTAAVGGGSCAMGTSSGAPVVVAAAGAPAASAAESSEPAPAMEVAQAATPPAEPAPMPESAPAPAEPMADASAMSSPAPESSAPVEAGGSCSTGLVDPNQAPVVVKAGGYPGDTSEPAAPTDLATAENNDAAAAAMTEPSAPVESAPPPPAPEPAPAPEAAPVEPAPAAAPPPPEPKAEAPKPAKPKSSAPSKPAAPKKAPAEAKVAWWPAKSDGKLNVVYAGEANFTKAIVILLDGQFDNADSAEQNIKVKPKKGGSVNGKWMVAKGNPSMLLLNVDPGLYTVEVGSGLTDKGGRAIGAASSGAVFVH